MGFISRKKSSMKVVFVHGGDYASLSFSNYIDFEGITLLEVWDKAKEEGGWYIEGYDCTIEALSLGK